MYLAERPFALWHRLSAGRKTVSQTINGGYFVSLNEKRIKPGAAKPITGIKRQPARNQIGKQADQALSTAREPISMPEGGAAAEAKLFEKVTARKEPQQRRKSTGAKTAGGAARSAAKTAAKKEDPKTAGRKKRRRRRKRKARPRPRRKRKSGQNNYPYRQAGTKKVR